MSRTSGPQKAALVILGLAEDVASLIMRQMEDDDLRELAQAVKVHEPFDVEQLQPALEEFEREIGGPVIPRAGIDYVRRLTRSALGEERASRIFAPAIIPQAAIDQLGSARPSALAALLREEHPQVAAALVSQLPSDRAAEILLALSEEESLDVLRRVSQLTEIPEQAVAVASEALAQAVSSTSTAGATSTQEFDGMAFAAGMVNEMTPDDSERVLQALEEVDAALVPKIREAMFNFEDLARLDARSMQTLMREVAADQMLIALKTASAELRDAFLGAISKRAADTMREDLELMQPQRLSEVEASQREIIDVAMQLGTDGKISMPSAGGEEMV